MKNLTRFIYDFVEDLRKTSGPRLTPWEEIKFVVDTLSHENVHKTRGSENHWADLDLAHGYVAHFVQGGPWLEHPEKDVFQDEATFLLDILRVIWARGKKWWPCAGPHFLKYSPDLSDLEAFVDWAYIHGAGCCEVVPNIEDEFLHALAVSINQGGWL